MEYLKFLVENTDFVDVNKQGAIVLTMIVSTASIEKKTFENKESFLKWIKNRFGIELKNSEAAFLFYHKNKCFYNVFFEFKRSVINRLKDEEKDSLVLPLQEEISERIDQLENQNKQPPKVFGDELGQL